MKKTYFQYYTFKVLLIISIIFLASCEKGNKFETDILLGNWKSSDLTYSLDFTSENDFLKNGDHYNYWLTKDSITVQYSGVMYILITPTTHSYKLKGNQLTIDFRPGCYGFNSQEIKFTR